MSRHATKGKDDLQTLYPGLANEWHPLLNGDLSPSDVLPGSSRKVVWRCSVCDYVWEAQICNRASLGRGCPCCSNKVAVKGVNDLTTTNPEIAKEWYQPLNGDVRPCDVTYGCGKKYNWMCPRGHIYSATVLHRTSGGTGCPVCNSGRQTSFAEQALFFYVKKVFPSAINGYKELFTKGMELDIYIPELKIGIEYDGVYWHHKKQAAYKREQRKYDICKNNGIYLIRVREQKIDEDERPAADWSLFLSDDKSYNESLNQAISWVIQKVFEESHLNGGSTPSIDISRDRFEILAYLKGPVKNSILDLAPEVAKEWDYKKNGGLKPDMIAGGSSQFVYWTCSVCGYNWEAPINQRVKNHSRCPKCAGLIFEKGVNDLKTKNPELLIDWDYDENTKKGIFPEELMYNSNKKASWKCHVCNYQWSVAVRARTVQGNGCIQCGYKAGKELKRRKIIEKQGCISNPLLLKEWDYERNAKIGLSPEKLPPGSSKVAYWICSKCGYKWEAPIARRNKGAGCRKCADKANPDLRRKRLIETGKGLTDELLTREWDYQKNQRKPQDYSSGSKYKAHWICSKCGFEWSAVIYSRTKGAGCPACAGNTVFTGRNDLATIRPDLLKEWDYEKNSDVRPEETSYSSSHKYWWICPEGHGSYLASPAHRINGTGCPICGNIRIGEKISKPVDQLTLDGAYIKTFKSVRAASQELKLSNGAISNAIRKGTTSGGYKWRHHV